VKLIDFKRLGSEKGIRYDRNHLRRKVNAGEFPRPIAVSDRRIAWIESEVDEWLAARPRAERKPASSIRK
jgi:predicted DNA-binding transcriptional regulator AlpA